MAIYIFGAYFNLSLLGKKVVLAGSEDPEDHAITVWNQLISRENNIKVGR